MRDASLSAMIDEAIDAVKRYTMNGALEATEYTQIIDAPPQTTLIIPYAPVSVAGFEFYLNVQANGDPAAFTSAFLLTMYQDYVLDVGPTDALTSESGLVRSLQGAWGIWFERPIYSLTNRLMPVRGAIKLVYTAGYATVPQSIKAALNLIVRKLFNMRKDGVPAISESLNGYSISRQNSATADGIIQGDPTIRNLLKTFCRPQVGSYF